MTVNGSDTDGIAALVGDAKRMTASPLLYIGAITVVFANEFVEWLGLTDTAAAAGIFVAALALLYGQLTILAWVRRRRDGAAPGC